jgi:hypothetical protein
LTPENEPAAEPAQDAAVAPPAPQASRPDGGHGHRYRRREIELTEGGKLILDSDGSIREVDADGVEKGAWSPGEPEWAGHAIRFGLRPQSQTVAPNSRRVRDARPSVG